MLQMDQFMSCAVHALVKQHGCSGIGAPEPQQPHSVDRKTCGIGPGKLLAPLVSALIKVPRSSPSVCILIIASAI
jgi:hypothetical protein